MSQHTPRNKRVKTVFMSGSDSQPAGDSDAQLGIGQHVFQDDVRVIGVLLTQEILVTDASLNADAQLELQAEVSRQAQFATDGVLMHVEGQAMWTAAITVHDNIRDQQLLMFPEGYGVDFDDGEGIFLHMGFNNGSTVTLSAFVNAIIYYVER